MAPEHSEGRSPVAEEQAESQASEESAASSQSSGTALVIPDVSGLSVLDSALAYGAAGIYIVPVHNRTKKPGGLLGNGWQHQSARDAETIRAWFEEWPQTRPLTWNRETQQREPWPTDPGIAVHAGRSGMVVFDIDTPEHLHPALARANGECSPPFQTSRVAQPGKGHALYLVPAGRDLGNSPGRLGGAWGEVRGANGVIVVAPTTHEDDLGHYEWQQVGRVPVLPGYVSELLGERLDSAAAVDREGAQAFLDDHPLREGDPAGLVAGHFHAFTASVSGGASRHGQMAGHLCGAMREAAEGLCDAQLAADELEEVFLEAVARSDRGSGNVRGTGEAAYEWAELLRYAIGQVVLASPGQAAARVEARVTERAAASGLTALPDEVDQVGARASAVGSAAQVEPESLLARFPRLDLAALLDPNRPPREWVVHGLVPAGASVSLVAPAGAMKSLLALAMTLAVSRGSSTFAGLPITRGRRVIYIDMENTEDDLAGRMRSLGATVADLDALVFLHLPPLPMLDSEAGGKLLVQLCQAYGLERGDLLVLDSFQRVVEGAENDSDTYRGFYTHAAVRLKKLGLTVLRTDNTGKDTGRGARGSSSKRDDVDIELLVDRSGDTLTLTPGKVRIDGVEKLTITAADGEDGSLTFTSAADPFRYQVEEIKAALDRAKAPLDLAERPCASVLKQAKVEYVRKPFRQAVKERRSISSDITDMSAVTRGFSAPRATAHSLPDSAPTQDGAPRRTRRETARKPRSEHAPSAP